MNEAGLNTYGQYLDMQAVSQYNIQSRLKDDPAAAFRGERWLGDRLAKLRAGREAVKLMGHEFVERKFREVDDNLRLRFEFDHPDPSQPPMYAIDRYVRELGYNWTLCYWSHSLGEGLALRNIMLESDMQRPEYHREKKLSQELILQQQKKKRDEIALAAWDQLSRKQAEEFLQVQMALRSGEKIVSVGRDAEILNRWAADTKLRDAQATQMQNDLRMGKKIILTDYD